MAFLDRIRVKVEAGSGGDGSVSFRREKFVPRGGPDGGDGGYGGDIVLRTTTSVQDFTHLTGVVLFRAESGGNGGASKRHGKNGEDLIMNVPPGTIVRNALTGDLIADLNSDAVDFIVARHGKGGRGNRHFATATNQTPKVAEKGTPGDALELELELKLIADVGLVGLPNAGKSTLLSKISEARPKIAPYPFTTLYPNLGVTDVDGFGRMVIADIPGLIQGAHMGVGLGDEFLRHIERTGVLLHLVDASAPDPVKDYRTIREELSAYGHGLAEKTLLVAANKMDLPSAAEGLRRLREDVRAEIVPISAATGVGIDELVSRLLAMVGRRAE